jgi:hypothetical protein
LQPYFDQNQVPALGYFLPTTESPMQDNDSGSDDDMLGDAGVLYEHIRDYNFTNGTASAIEPMKKTKNVCFSMDVDGKVKWVDVGYTVKARRRGGAGIKV